jgi:BASS family bile acid:Na+ symporter
MPDPAGKPRRVTGWRNALDAAILVKLVLVASVFLLVFSTGLAAPAGSARAALSRTGEMGRAALAMFILFPLATALIVWSLPLSPTTRAVLIALSVSPIAPILTPKQLKVGGGYDYAVALQFLAAALTLVAAPLALAIYEQRAGRAHGFGVSEILPMILITIVVPLLAGLAVVNLAPAAAARLVGPVHRVGTVLLLGGLLVVLVAAGGQILAVASGVTLVAVLLMTVAAIAIGYTLGGPRVGNRNALALATMTRHPGVAIGVAVATDLAAPQSVAPIAFLYLLASALFSIPFMRQAKAGTA